MSDLIARTPAPPYFAVVFTSLRGIDDDGYAAMAAAMDELAARQDGYLGHESARSGDGLGITVSYWRDEAAIARWREDAEHRLARRLGRERWYDRYAVRVARVERAYGAGTAEATSQKAV